MKNLIIIIMSILYLSVYTQNEYKPIKRINKIRIFYPVHSFFENEYGNVFVSNGLALGIEYVHEFKKAKFGIFTSAQFTFYSMPFKNILYVKYDPSKTKKNFLRTRTVSLISIGFKKELYRFNKFNLIAKGFLNYRYGQKIVTKNIDFYLWENSKNVHYNDFGIGAGLSLNYGFTDMFSIGLDYALVGYVYRYKTYIPSIGISTSPLMMYYSLSLEFSF